jgi:hypothetical protein
MRTVYVVDTGDRELLLIADVEKELVRLCQKGDKGAYVRLVHVYSGRVFAVCLGMLGNRHDAEDAAQRRSSGFCADQIAWQRRTIRGLGGWAHRKRLPQATRLVGWSAAARLILAAGIPVVGTRLGGKSDAPPAGPRETWVAPDPDPATPTIDVGLGPVWQYAAARDIDGLLSILWQREFQGRVAAAKHLARIGDLRAVPALQQLAEAWTEPGRDNPFQQAIVETRRCDTTTQARLSPPRSCCSITVARCWKRPRPIKTGDFF